MTGGHDRLTEVLDGYAKLLREKELELPSHQPYRVRWMKGFLRFTRDHVGFTFGQTLDLFRARPSPLAGGAVGGGAAAEDGAADVAGEISGVAARGPFVKQRQPSNVGL